MEAAVEELLDRDRGDDAGRQQQQDELAGERRDRSIFSAGNSTTWRKIWQPVRPSERPASIWLRGIASKPARTISVA